MSPHQLALSSGVEPSRDHFTADSVVRQNGLGMGGHQSHSMGKDEWLTPPEILTALGPFDLDPCAPIVRPWDTAARHFTIQDNGLLRPWQGRVWCNPPYGRETGRWLNRCAEHGNAVALIFARTETADWIAHVWNRADAVMFLFGRLHFHHVSGKRAEANSGAPSALVAYGSNNVEALARCGLKGRVVVLANTTGQRSAAQGDDHAKA